MDGHFVPNLTIGPPVVSSLREHTDLFFDTHLMITDPGRFLEAFRDAGSDGCTVHVEVGDTADHIAQMRELGLRVGLAANPDTPFEALEPFLDQVDLILCMTVFPGLRRPVVHRRRHAQGAPGARRGPAATALTLDVEVDGGIDEHTVVEAARSGANVFVAGSAVFGRAHPLDAARDILRAADRRPGGRSVLNRPDDAAGDAAGRCRVDGAGPGGGRDRSRAAPRPIPGSAPWSSRRVPPGQPARFEGATAPPGGPHAEVAALRPPGRRPSGAPCTSPSSRARTTAGRPRVPRPSWPPGSDGWSWPSRIPTPAWMVAGHRPPALRRRRGRGRRG